MGGKSGKMAKDENKKERLRSKKYDDSFMSETDWLYMQATQGSQKFNTGSSYSSYKAPGNTTPHEAKSKMQRFGSAGSTGFTRDHVDTNEIVTSDKVV